MKSSELSRAQLIRMIGRLRGVAYDFSWDLRDAGNKTEHEEVEDILTSTAFDVDEDIEKHK